MRAHTHTHTHTHTEGKNIAIRLLSLEALWFLAITKRRGLAVEHHTSQEEIAKCSDFRASWNGCRRQRKKGWLKAGSGEPAASA
jgi:hypothetical protein